MRRAVLPARGHALLAALLAACASDASTPDGAAPPTADLAMASTVPDLATVADLVVYPPPAPQLGALIDRAGRPLVTSALLDSFDWDGRRMVGLDVYNQSDITVSPDSFSAPLETGLETFDAFDGACGNQLLFQGLPQPVYPSSSYVRMAHLLADDRLYVQTTLTACHTLLAVELASFSGQPLTDCGGRAPSVDVVDAVYSLAAGPAMGPLGDGVAGDPDGAASDDNFPFLGPPNP